MERADDVGRLAFVKNVAILAAVALAPVALATCTSSAKISVKNAAKLQAAKSAYVAFEGGSSQDVANGLEIAMAKRGLKTTGGRRADAPKSTDLLVTFEDHWTWAMTMWLLGLNVKIREAQTGFPVADGDFVFAYRRAPDGTDDAVRRIIEQAK